jgi:hypothetical protein
VRGSKLPNFLSSGLPHRSRLLYSFYPATPVVSVFEVVAQVFGLRQRLQLTNAIEFQRGSLLVWLPRLSILGLDF